MRRFGPEIHLFPNDQHAKSSTLNRARHATGMRRDVSPFPQQFTLSTRLCPRTHVPFNR
jgi:hypothetical protein